MCRSISLAAILFLITLPLFAKSDPIRGSSVRIVEGLTAPGWEMRFLPPQEKKAEPDTAAEPDADILATPPYSVKQRITPVNRTVTRRAVAPVEKKNIAPVEETPPVVKTPPAVAKKPTAPVTPPPIVQPPSKIDKEEETDDDSAGKRKKERRDTLREGRKERNYNNRRVE